jgi:hypothetical protein
MVLHFIITWILLTWNFDILIDTTPFNFLRLNLSIRNFCDLWRMPSSEMLCRVALVRTNAPPKRRFLQEPQGVTSQRTAFFIVTAVKTSYLTSVIFVYLLPVSPCCLPQTESGQYHNLLPWTIGQQVYLNGVTYLSKYVKWSGVGVGFHYGFTSSGQCWMRPILAMEGSFKYTE